MTRYTAQSHVDLPIQQALLALARDKRFVEQAAGWGERLSKCLEDVQRAPAGVAMKDALAKASAPAGALITSLEQRLDQVEELPIAQWGRYGAALAGRIVTARRPMAPASTATRTAPRDELYGRSPACTACRPARVVRRHPVEGCTPSSPASALRRRCCPDLAIDGRSAKNASQLQRTGCPAVKSATLPSLRVEPELREAAESMLQEGETLSGFIEASVRETIQRRRVRAQFIAPGLASREQAKRTGVYIDADVVHAELAKKLAHARTRLQKKARA